MTTANRNNNSGKRPSLKEMAFEKLGFANRRFRSQSFDSGPSSSSPETTEEPLFPEVKKHYSFDKRKKSFQHNSSIPEPLQVSVEDEKEKEKPPLERRKSRPQPIGTITYEVTLRDTLVSIAAKFGTTPSNLLQINRMSCRIICPGQVLYVPGPDYDAINNISEPSSPIITAIPDEETPILDASLSDKPCSKVPGHAERLPSISSPKEVVEISDPPRRITEEEARKLDEECVSRFLKFDAKHITDGQGVVNGTLIVTPNAIMFDPSVHDPLVIEHGNDNYGMVAAMETIISAAIYRDLKTMKIEGQADCEDVEVPKAEVYCGQGHFKFASSKQENEPDYMKTTNKLVQIMQAVQSSQYDDGMAKETDIFMRTEDQTKAVTPEAAVPTSEAAAAPTSEAAAVPTSEAAAVPISEAAAVTSEAAAAPISEAAAAPTSEAAAAPTSEAAAAPTSEAVAAPTSEAAATPEAAAATPAEVAATAAITAEAAATTTAATVATATTTAATATTTTTALATATTTTTVATTAPDLPVTKITDLLPSVEGKLENLSLAAEQQQQQGSDAESGQSCVVAESVKTQPRTTPDASLALDADQSLCKEPFLQSLEKIKEEPKEVDVPAASDEEKLEVDVGKDDSSSSGEASQGVTGASLEAESVKEPESDTAATQPKLSPKDPTMTASMIEGSPKLKAIYNYAAGFFSSSTTEKLAEKARTGTPEWPSPSVVIASQHAGVCLPASPTSPRPPGVEYTTKRGTRVRVVSAVTMQDTPNLFQPMSKDDDLKASSPTIRYEEPPLFLCLKVGKPKNTTVTYEAPFSTYGKAKKPEYWFTVSQEKADNFYAFLLHWKPEIYGDDEETEARKMGFVIFDNSNKQPDEDDLDILDEYFGHRESISKDWEIVTSDEDYRKKSLDIDDTPFLPELVGETHILTEDHIATLVDHLPGRTVGYSWVLIYSTDLHGFSLKSLYRFMVDYESPVLLTVRNTHNQVFGALISCPLKVSDHFYGTGESFLFTFHPTFRIFRWTGENNFFVKGNQESLAIGAGKGFFGLWFDGDLYHGRSHPCDTFGNDVLSEEEDFVVQAFEAWGFV